MSFLSLLKWVGERDKNTPERWSVDKTSRQDPTVFVFFSIYKKAYTILDQYLSTTFPKNDL